MDSVSEAADLVKSLGLGYKLLSDPQANMIKAYGVYNLLDDGVATPSVFIIGSGKKIIWNYIGENISDRPSIENILAKFN